MTDICLVYTRTIYNYYLTQFINNNETIFNLYISGVDDAG